MFTQGRNGVGIVISDKLADNIVSVERSSDRLMSVRMVIDAVLTTVICAYAPQGGYDEEEKGKFWD